MIVLERILLRIIDYLKGPTSVRHEAAQVWIRNVGFICCIGTGRMCSAQNPKGRLDGSAPSRRREGPGATAGRVSVLG